MYLVLDSLSGGSGAEDQVAGIARPVEHFTSHA